MTYVQAQHFLQKYGWSQGFGISKLFQPTDVGILRTMKAVAAHRPRGVLSGFLAVLPETQGIFFVGPKSSPRQIRMRIGDEICKEGVILSAYEDGTDLVLEDVLVWKGVALFRTQSFDARWKHMQEFVDAWKPDPALQGCGIRLASYVALEDVGEPEDRQVLEFIPIAPGMKRMVWIPTEEVERTTWIAKRERLVGPDIFSLWSMQGEKQSTLALVRTLQISRMLHCHPVDEFKVQSIWSKRFGRWEIVGIA